MENTVTELSLNSLPRGLDFEDFISAHLLLGGYTLDRSIHERVEGAGEIFEVDIVTHQYNGKDTKRLIEIKSKDWDLSDIFKLGGRLRYLGVESGVFIVQQKKEEKRFASWQVSMREKMDVSLIFSGKREPTDTKLDLTDLYNDFGIKAGLFDDGMIEAVRFSYIVERCMRRRVSLLKKSKQILGLNVLWDFSNAIQDISFFDDDPVMRLHRTFDLFREYNHLSARLDYEELHGCFPAIDEVVQFESGRVKGYLLNKIDYLPVNYSLFLEHRLRMYIIQSCVEYLVMPEVFQNRIDEFLKRLSLHALSSNISNGIKYMSEKCPHFMYYPRFWQIFSYMMGGFILIDHYEEEIELLYKVSGVPKDEVEEAFRVYDILFPLAGETSWLREIRGTHIKRLNFMPAPILGIGANFRRIFYRKDKTMTDPPYEDLEETLSNDYTLPNLLLWNEAAFDVLKTSDDLEKN